VDCSHLGCINNNKPKDKMNESIKDMKADAEIKVEAILEDLEKRGIKVYRLQVFPRHKQPPQVSIVVDEKGIR